MALTGTTNTSANTAIRYLTQNTMMASSSLAKLSSGSRIVKASDDAASLAVGTKVMADVTALKQAAVNAGQASSLLQVADGGMARIADILQRMKALATQSSSGQLTDTERGFLNQEYTQLRSQITDIATQTKFNGQPLLDGGLGTTVDLTNAPSLAARGVTVRVTGDVNTGGDTDAVFQLAYAADEANGVGTFTLTAGGADDSVASAANNLTFSASISINTTGLTVFDGTVRFEDAGIELDLSNFVAGDSVTAANADLAAGAATTQFAVTQTGSLSFQVGTAAADSIAVSIAGLDATDLGVATDIGTAADAAAASGEVDAAIEAVNSARADLGAYMSRIEIVSANLATSVENLDAARSTLMDVDMAAEMSKFSSAQVLTQAGVAMLAQANQMPQNLLKLLQ
jgi:flagellin